MKYVIARKENFQQIESSINKKIKNYTISIEFQIIKIITDVEILSDMETQEILIEINTDMNQITAITMDTAAQKSQVKQIFQQVQHHHNHRRIVNE